MKKALAVLLVILVSLFIAVVVYAPQYLALQDMAVEEQPLLLPEAGSDDEDAQERTYASSTLGVSFNYPLEYYLYEREAGTAERPQHAIVLAEDTQENRDLLSGVSSEPREGPTSITLDVYENTDGLSPQEWAKQDTNWNISNKEISSITVGGKQGVTYRWDGLYPGKSFIVTSDVYAYVFSVTWMSQSDRTINDFADLLDTVEFIN